MLIAKGALYEIEYSANFTIKYTIIEPLCKICIQKFVSLYIHIKLFLKLFQFLINLNILGRHKLF